MTEFPAAHSMDTLWFAVDREGCVGVFDSDEGGAVPRAVRSPVNEDPAAVEPWLPGKTSLDAMVPVLSRKEIDRRLEDHEWGAQILFPRDAESFAACKRILDGEPRLFWPSTLPLRDGPALFVSQRPSLLGRLLIRWRSRGVWRALPSEAGWLWACGFVCYRGHGGSPDGGPYHRLPLLPHSVSLPHLPADLVGQVSVVRFDCSFREKETLQPCQHVPCLGWNGGWTDESGTRHESGLGEAWRSDADV